ncbi:hypothetical protein AAF712_009615 [Marasmius tenuissimus]|uniref:F-box domain-containing protein n=1 Tax=Marasmius tenuissimus TaxID=585030 RepID=A0ABR2ZQ35_9AGAR
MNISADQHPIESHFLSSNYVPTNAEISRTKMFIQEEEAALAACERGIASFHQVLEDLETRRMVLEERIKQRRDTVSVRRRIPVELWEQIFAMVYSMKEDEYLLTLRSSRGVLPVMAPAVALSQVCSRWRGIVLSTPGLWASISISFSSILPSFQPILELYLRNSKQHPLRIELAGGSFFGSIPYDVRVLWDTIMSHIPRCESLACCHLGRRFVMPRDSLSNITTLIDDETDDCSAWQDALKDAHRLTSVTSWFLYPLHHLPYNQLASLEYRSLLHKDIERLARKVLPSCAKLKSLVLRDPVADSSHTDISHGSSRSRLRTIPTLRSLSVIFSALEDAVDVGSSIYETIFSLKAPALTTLRLNFSQGQAAEWAPALVAVLAQTSASLRSLSLSIAHLSIPRNQALSALLEVVPNLVEFDLVLERARGTTPHSMDRWAYQDFLLRHLGELFQGIWQTTTFVPKLTNISVFVANHMILTNDFVDLVFKAAESRTSALISAGVGINANVSPLASVKVTCRRLKKGKATGPWETFALSSEARERIRHLLRGGVRVVMEGQNDTKSTSVDEFSILDAYSTSFFAT